MKFETALRKMRKGEWCRPEAWLKHVDSDNKSPRVTVQDFKGKLVFVREDGSYYRPNVQDVLEMNWLEAD